MAGDNNRRATAARIINQTPVFRKIETKFGPVMERTNRFTETRGIPMPRYSRLMTDKEKETRRKIKRLKHGKTQHEPDTIKEIADLRQELHKIMNN